MHTETHGKRRKRLWTQILAGIAVFVTTYALILPAITLDLETAAEEPGVVLETVETFFAETASPGAESTETASPSAEPTETLPLESGLVETEPVPADPAETEPEEPPAETAPKTQPAGDPNADLETAADWERSLSGLELTGRWADDLLLVAESQMGCAESTRNYITDADGVRRGYSRYGAWYGSPYGDWCAMFASFCLHYAQVSEDDFPLEASCPRWIKKLTELDRYVPAEEGKPAPGDLVFFDRNDDSVSDHVGIVVKADKDEGIETVEGNSGNRVARRSYRWDDKRLLGYGLLPENSAPFGMRLHTESKRYDVTVHYGVDARVPADAVLRVTEYDEDSDEYRQAREAWLAAKQADGQSVDESTLGFAAIDVSILDAEGEELEPAAPVRVEISMRKLPDELTAEQLRQTLEVQHLMEENEELTVQETVNVTSDESEGSVEITDETPTATIQVDGLSPFTITWNIDNRNRVTVNLRYFDTDGNEITSLVPGSITKTITGTTDGDTKWIYLLDGQYAKTVDGYTFQRAEYHDISVDYLHFVRKINNWDDSYYAYIYHADSQNEAEEVKLTSADQLEIRFIYQKDSRAPGGDSDEGQEATVVLHYKDGDTELTEPVEITVTATEAGAVINLMDSLYRKELDGYTFERLSCYNKHDFDSVRVMLSKNSEDVLVPVCWFLKDGVLQGGYSFDGGTMDITYAYVSEKAEEKETVGTLLLCYVNDEDGSELTDTRYTLALKEGDSIDLAAYAYEISGYTFTDQITNEEASAVDHAAVVKNKDGSFALQFKANDKNVGDSIPLSEASELPVIYHYTKKTAPAADDTDVQAKLVLHYRDERGKEFVEKISLNLKTGDSIDLLHSEYYKAFDDHPFKSLTLAGQEVARVAVVRELERIGWVFYQTQTYTVFYDRYGNEILREETNPDDPKTYEAFYMYTGRMDEGGGGTSSHSGSGTRALPEPDLSKLPDLSASKRLTPNLKDPDDPNSGDGTYTLTLSVQVPKLEGMTQNRANIVIAFDSSNSMTEATEYIPDDNGEYGTCNGKDFDKRYWQWNDDWYANNPQYYNVGDPRYGKWMIYNREIGKPEEFGNRQRYRPGPITRMDVSRRMVKLLGDDLLALNDTFGKGTVEMAFVEYGTVILHGSDDVNRITDDSTVFNAWVDSCRSPKEEDSTKGATNWELALKTADSIRFDDDPTYIIFISDGNPTVRVSPPANGDGDRIGNGEDMGVYGTGNSDTKSYNFNAAEAVAKSILGKNKVLFNVGIFGDATTMGNLSNNGYYEGGDEAQMAAAFDDIIKSITKRLGYTDVKVTDGITSMTSSTLVHGDPKDFTYKVTDAKGNDVTAQVLRPEQRNARYGAPDNENECGKVTWDLGEGLVLDGGTYSVSFVVWPNQDAYDLVSDLNNGIRKWEKLTDVEKAQVVGSGDGTKAPFSLRTNTEAGVTYKPVIEVTDSSGNSSLKKGEQRKINLDPPDPMPLVDTKVKVQKTWNVSLDPSELADFLKKNPDFKVNLDLMKEDTAYVSGILIEPVAGSSVWPDSNHPDGYHISEGLMVSEDAAAASGLAVRDQSGAPYYPTTVYRDKTYYILEPGRDYRFREKEFDVHFELEDRVFHPMVVDGVKLDVTFGENHKVIRAVPFENTVSAVNSLRGGIALRKYIVDSEGNTVEDDTGSAFVIHGSITAKDPVTGEFVAVPDLQYRYYYDGGDRSDKVTLKNSADFTVTLHTGETLRFVNVPTGCRYEFYELENKTYRFYSIEGSFYTKDQDGKEVPVESPGFAISEDGTRASGVSMPNTSQNIVLRNTLQRVILELTKTDMSGEKKLSGAEFRLYADPACTTPARDADGKEIPAGTTGQDGTLRFAYLYPGVYYLKETKAPEGYVPLNAPAEVKITNDGMTYTVNKKPGKTTETLTESDGTEIMTFGAVIENSTGYSLPNTGGPGTKAFTYGGTLLLLAACVLAYQILRRRDLPEAKGGSPG